MNFKQLFAFSAACLASTQASPAPCEQTRRLTRHAKPTIDMANRFAQAQTAPPIVRTVVTAFDAIAAYTHAADTDAADLADRHAAAVSATEAAVTEAKRPFPIEATGDEDYMQLPILADANVLYQKVDPISDLQPFACSTCGDSCPYNVARRLLVRADLALELAFGALKVERPGKRGAALWVALGSPDCVEMHYDG